MKRPPTFICSPVYRETGYGPNHPLGIQRIGTVLDLCDALGWLDGGYVDSPAATADVLVGFHDRDYIDALLAADTTGHVTQDVRQSHGLGTMENPLFKGVFQRAATSVGGSIRAAELALEGRVAYHPAGGTHHGRPGRASGFCYFNDPVFAILTLLDAGLDRVAYVDIDAHHGDGVEDAFSGDARVLTASVHEAGRWPYTGPTGFDRDQGVLNLCVPKGCSDSEFRLLFEDGLLPAVAAFRPGAVVVTCGADALAGDPLSGMQLGNGTLWDATLAVCALAPSAVVLGGGGYNPWTAARCWAGLWARLSGQPVPDVLPPAARHCLTGLESDLVDEDDVQAHWLTSIADPPRAGPVRDDVRALAATIKDPAPAPDT